jgi:hypothetical protein
MGDICEDCGRSVDEEPVPESEGIKKQEEEMPLEKELYGISHIAHCDKIGNCIRYLRDEIQKLKEAR